MKFAFVVFVVLAVFAFSVTDAWDCPTWLAKLSDVAENKLREKCADGIRAGFCSCFTITTI